MNDKLRSALAELESVERAFPGKVEAMKTKLSAWVIANTGPGNDGNTATLLGAAKHLAENAQLR